MNNGNGMHKSETNKRAELKRLEDKEKIIQPMEWKGVLLFLTQNE
jgi:hypothetical protein